MIRSAYAPMVYYGNNDWRDYLAHAQGERKFHKYIKKIGQGANAVYIYAKDAAKKVGSAARKAGAAVGTAAGKVTGSYYKKQADSYNKQALTYLGLGNQSGFAMASQKSGEYSKKYVNSIGQRSIRAAKAIGKAAKGAFTAAKSAISSMKIGQGIKWLAKKGKSLADKILGVAKKAVGAAKKAYGDIKSRIPKRKPKQKAVG